MLKTHFAELFEVALSGIIPYARLAQIAGASAMTVPDTLDAFAVYVAQAYAEEKMSFEAADAVMNAAFGVAVSQEFSAEHDTARFPAKMYEVYQAFDAGEDAHLGDDESIDPELKYTQPLIQRFLSTHTHLVACVAPPRAHSPEIE